MKDETCVQQYGLETKAQSKQGKHFDSSPEKAHVTPLTGRVNHPFFWDQHGLAMMAFPSKKFSNYWSLLCFTSTELREGITSKRCRTLTKSVCLLQDNAHVYDVHFAQMEYRSLEQIKFRRFADAATETQANGRSAEDNNIVNALEKKKKRREKHSTI